MAKSKSKAPRTEIVRASELHEKVILPIARLQDPEFAKAEKEYPKWLAAYEEKRAGRPETFENRGIFDKTQIPTGYYKEINAAGRPVFVKRPQPPEQPRAYSYSGYERYSVLTSYAEQRGTLPHSKFNREIRDARVKEYIAIMRAGEWHDLLSDPITITPDGHVLNGQHRLAAAGVVHGYGWNTISSDPLFMVIWGVDPAEALYADGSKRTAKDQATIGQKVAGTYRAERKPTFDEQADALRASLYDDGEAA